jgi:hypothetical protein
MTNKEVLSEFLKPPGYSVLRVGILDRDSFDPRGRYPIQGIRSIGSTSGPSSGRTGFQLLGPAGLDFQGSVSDIHGCCGDVG